MFTAHKPLSSLEVRASRAQRRDGVRGPYSVRKRESVGVRGVARPHVAHTHAHTLGAPAARPPELLRLFACASPLARLSSLSLSRALTSLSPLLSQRDADYRLFGQRQVRISQGGSR